MSSLKGQLSDMEGSVKTMKMAVVVGSVLTVACLAAVFGVTILANEVSKETKVSNGALVNRQGDTVKTQNKAEALSFYEAVEAKTVVAGDIMNIANHLGRVSATVEGISYLTEGMAIVKVTGATLLFKDADAEMLYVADNADNDMSPVKIITAPINLPSERKLMWSAWQEDIENGATWLADKAFNFVVKAPGAVLEVFIFKPLAQINQLGGMGCPCAGCCSGGQIVM